MIVWMIALLLLAASCVLGYTMGAVRVGITTVGLVLGAAICVPVSPILYPMVEKMGSRAHAVFIAPLIVLMVVLIVFKVIASAAHQKLDSYYKYKTAEYVQTLWLRTNERFGAALGAVNALIYLLIVCTFIFVLGYPVRQLASGDRDSTAWQYLVKATEALQKTGMDKTVAAFNPTPESYYHTCDMIGMVHQNPLLIGRLTSYPPIMALGEQEQYRPMFDEIANDLEFSQKLFEQPRPAFQEILGLPKLQMILTNKPFMNEILKLDFKDLSNYLATGVSEKFSSEKLLGRWRYNFEASLNAQRRTKPKWTAIELLRLRASYTTNIETASLSGLINNQVVLRLTDANKTLVISRGSYSAAGDNKYEISWDSGPWGKEAELQGSDRLRLRHKIGGERDGRIIIFDKD